VQGLLRPKNLPAKSEQGLFEMGFVFAAVWAFGGALCEKDGVKYRQQFDKWWKVSVAGQEREEGKEGVKVGVAGPFRRGQAGSGGQCRPLVSAYGAAPG
jgi:hypothetical protein